MADNWFIMIPSTECGGRQVSDDLYRLPDGRTKLKAHDIRHLCVCAHCDGMADDRDTVHDLHPKCFYEMEGRAGVLALCDDDQSKFALSDIPATLMKELIG